MRDEVARRGVQGLRERVEMESRIWERHSGRHTELHALCAICGLVVHVGLDGERLLATHPMERNRVIHSRCRPDTKDDRRKKAAEDA